MRFIVSLLLLCSCVAPAGGYYGSAGGMMSTGGCIANPYMFNLDPQAWQTWERANYYVSCTRYSVGY
ncbi:hypothetical protein [Candidatus Deianiraea vastatrix]|uniref:Uncharacterized protein n=1 Tax=Candidatus Deianiraea vastatrix TaxID=2163644 RepID=A0A5B8XF20_9RICK|nr:hypothetical protein [Candidatus Deianiraea vastatrix]QED22941.1 hypothetical protein Deia_00129 [Candidatus Deianiraea vastatrix]